MQDMSFVNRSYRYYTGKPLFPFGHGLSLTDFELEACHCNQTTLNRYDCACTLENTGGRCGDEVILVYHSVGDRIRSLASKLHPVPLKQLVEFSRFTLEAGESTKAYFSLPSDALALTTADGSMRIYPGEHSFIFSHGSLGDQAVTVNAA